MKFRFFRASVALTIGLMSQLGLPAFAETPEFRDSAPKTYTVKKSDTLWDISNAFLENPWLWPEIWHVNAQIDNPHLIYPGDIIRLVDINGETKLSLDRSERLYKLTPEARVISVGEAIETIPLSKINSFLSRSRVLDKKALKLTPYVVSGTDDHLISGAGDRLYVRGQVEGKFSVYGIYRQGQVFKDPVTKEFLGIQAIDIGTGEVRDINGEIATLLISRTTEEIRAGDRLLREEERVVDSTFYPTSPDYEIENGFIIGVEEGVNQVGKLSVVIINKGERDNLKNGNVLSIYKKGNKIRDRVSGGNVQLPDEHAGMLMVFRTFEKVSYALVLEAKFGITVDDLVKNPS